MTRTQARRALAALLASKLEDVGSAVPATNTRLLKQLERGLLAAKRRRHRQ